jgi:hypothetical protein
MKNFILPIALFFVLKISAQIPSGDFETWNSFGAYMQPNGWVSTNEYSPGPFYAITRDTSHFPPLIGTYSIRLENNLSAGFPDGGGAAKTGDTLFGAGLFPITGHPTSLTGYYRFLPQNGDTMTIRVRLYLNGSQVAEAIGHSTVAEPAWVSFILPISTYITADSAEVLLSAFNIDTNVVSPYPQGNSVLYIDNLNFDNLITSVNNISLSGLSIYPNPATNQLYVDAGDNKNYLQLELMDQLGKIVLSATIQGKQQVDISFLPSGVYQVSIRNNQQKLINKKLIKTD